MKLQEIKVGQKNIIFGWIWLLAGLLLGAVMSLWSFNGPFPSPVGDYTALPRRFLRLAHIAFIALAIINILYGYNIDNTELKRKLKKIGSHSLVFGSIFMPILLIISAFFETFKYLLVIPASLLIIGIFVMVIGLFKLQSHSI